MHVNDDNFCNGVSITGNTFVDDVLAGGWRNVVLFGNPTRIEPLAQLLRSNGVRVGLNIPPNRWHDLIVVFDEWYCPLKPCVRCPVIRL